MTGGELTAEGGIPGQSACRSRCEELDEHGTGRRGEEGRAEKGAPTPGPRGAASSRSLFLPVTLPPALCLSRHGEPAP